MKPHILIGIASRGRDIHFKLPAYIHYMLNRKDYKCDLWVSMCPYGADIAQNELFQKAMDEDYDYLLNIDSDVIPQPDTLDKLLAVGDGVVSAPIWHYDYERCYLHLNVVLAHGRTHIEKSFGAEEIKGSSFGCLLVSKKVLDKFKALKESPVFWSPMLDKGMLRTTSDCILFAKLKKLGVRAYVCWNAKGISHLQTFDLSSSTLDKLGKDLLTRIGQHKIWEVEGETSN